MAGRDVLHCAGAGGSGTATAAAERDSIPVPSVEVAEARVGCRVPRPCLRTTPGLPARPCIAPMQPERGFTSCVPTAFFCRGGKRPAGISCAPTKPFRQTEISSQAIYHAAQAVYHMAKPYFILRSNISLRSVSGATCLRRAKGHWPSALPSCCRAKFIRVPAGPWAAG